MLTFNKNSENSNTTELPLEKIISVFKEILVHRFPGDNERQRVVKSGKRLTICCPYCGDSHDNPRNKRGNLYLDSLHFKCYNGGCDTYVNLVKMIKDYKVSSVLTDEELTAAKMTIMTSNENTRQERSMRHDLSLKALTNADFTKVLVPRADLMKALNLQEVHYKSPMGIYLTKRLQNPDERFAWDARKKRLFIFNLDQTKSWVFALQTRQFDNDNSKYLTYNLSGIWFKMMGCKDEAFLEKTREMDQSSTVFGILNINFNNMITLFEGPLDSFAYGNNSVGMCSINNSWPFDVSNIRWFQDNDKAGTAKALAALNEGMQVFLWKKFIDEFDLHGKKIKDYNDIVVYERANNVKFGSLEKFFSTHKYDGIYLQE